MLGRTPHTCTHARTYARTHTHTHVLCYHLPAVSSPPPGLRHPVVPGLQDPKGALVAHTDETAQSKLQDHAALEGDKVPHILEQEELWPVVVAVAQVSCHQ